MMFECVVVQIPGSCIVAGKDFTSTTQPPRPVGTIVLPLQSPHSCEFPTIIIPPAVVTNTLLSLLRDVLKSRHLWMWERGIFEGLCEVGEVGEEGEESGLTRRTLSATLSHFMTQHQ